MGYLFSHNVSLLIVRIDQLNITVRANYLIDASNDIFIT